MILINLDLMLTKRKMSSGELAQRVGITPANLSILKTGKAKAIRFATLEAICRELQCQPGDILAFQEEEGWKENKKALKGVAQFYKAVTGEEMPKAYTDHVDAFYKAIGESVRIVEEDEPEKAGQ